MPLIRKSNASFQTNLLPRVEGGRLIEKRFFLEDNYGNAFIPSPAGATILKAGSFAVMENGDIRISDKFLKDHPNGVTEVDASIILMDPEANMMVPNKLIPAARIIMARERDVDRQILLKAHGGVGDVVCAEPAIRFAVERFKGTGNKVSLCTDYPEFFQHLHFEAVYPASGEGVPDYNKFLVFQNFTPGDELAHEFASHALMPATDYASINMWRLILPIGLKEITLKPTAEQREAMREKLGGGDLSEAIVVHPGKTWDSRTFPKKFWDSVLATIRESGRRLIVIGGEVDNKRASTVQVDAKPEEDFRSKLLFIETTALLQECAVLLTNDSSPLHIAASGDAFIGFVSTVKPTSHLLHWRGGVFGHRMKDFSSGCMWDIIDMCPNQEKAVHVDGIHINDLLRWLPDPKEFAAWALAQKRMEEK